MSSDRLSHYDADGRLFIRGQSQTFVRVTHEVPCRPLDSFTLSLDSLSSPVFCPDLTRRYNLDSLEISEDLFEREKLFRVVKKLGWYSFLFENSDTSACVSILKFFLTIEVPVVLNGVELSDAEKVSALDMIDPSRIVSLKAKRRYLFFGKKYLEILTK